MRAYSEDLRTRVVAAVDQGVPRDEVARLFQVSAPTIKRWLRLRRETGQLGARPIPGPPARKMDALRAELPAQLRDGAVAVSARTGEGADALLAAIDRALHTDPLLEAELRVPQQEGAVLAAIEEHAGNAGAFFGGARACG